MLNEASNDKEYELNQKIEKLTEYEKLPYRLRVFYYINNDIIKNSWDKMEDSEKFISDLKDKEEASDIYDYIKENGNIGIDKEQFIERISKDNESEQYLTQILPLEEELKKTKNSFFNDWVDDDEVLGLGLILFSLFFLLRYLIYATKWSVKQLKQ